MSKDLFPVAIGRDVGAIHPGQGFDPRVELDWANLVELLTRHEARADKDGRYITRPMKGDGTRSDANADDWRLIPVDVDELQPADLPLLKKWCEDSGLAGCFSSTYSHRPERPKVRIWLIASRLVTAAEHPYLHRALARLVPFKMDPCMAKPSQPVFLPACPPENIGEAFAQAMAGQPLDVDRVLDGYRAEMEAEQRDRAMRTKGIGTGVRQPGGLIEYFNQNYDLTDLLERHNYKRKTRNRYIAPGSKSRRAAVVLYDHSVVSFHDPDNDPLAVRNRNAQAIVLDAFAAYCKLDHADNFKAAFDGALKWARTKGWSDGAAGSAQQNGLAAPPPPIVLFNPEELYSHVKPQHFIVEGLLDAGAVVIAAGDSNSGKTTILQYMSMQVAQGLPFANRKVKQGRVLWIAGEDMENAKYRVIAMCEEYGIAPSSLGDNMLVLPQPVAVLQQDSMDAVRAAIEQRCGAGVEFALVILDSKSVNWGGSEENSNDENANFIAAVRLNLINPFGRPSVLITHHLTKQKEKEARSSRGASSLINNADHEWRFEMNQEARLSSMMPGSKVRMERWAEQRFLIKSVSLPASKFPQLLNNFGDTPRVSIAEPVNQYNKSMKQLQQDSDLRALLIGLAGLIDAGKPYGFTHLAEEVHWSTPEGKPDYRRVKRMLEYGAGQKLAEPDKKDAKRYGITKAGRDYIATAPLEEEGSDPAPEREPGSDDA